MRLEIDIHWVQWFFAVHFVDASAEGEKEGVATAMEFLKERALVVVVVSSISAA